MMAIAIVGFEGYDRGDADRPRTYPKGPMAQPRLLIDPDAVSARMTFDRFLPDGPIGFEVTAEFLGTFSGQHSVPVSPVAP